MNTHTTRRSILRGGLALAGLGIAGIPDWALPLLAEGEMLVPFNAAGPAAKPVLDVVAACKAKGVWPFSHFNRIHVTPPCTTTADEIHHGLAVLDEALTLADQHYTG